MNHPQDTQQVWFGNRLVDKDSKTTMVKDVFNRVAIKYDLMNDLMSLGIHRLWKNVMVSVADPQPYQQILDVAGGTGDIALRLVKACGGSPAMQAKGGQVIVADLTPAMLEMGQKKALDQGITTGISWVNANAENMPIASQTIDLYTVAFGLRNMGNIAAVLKEAYRVLKPGSRFCCLEFSPSALPFLQRLYDLYSFHLLPKLGRLVAKDQDSYLYLVESIRKFPSPEHLVDQLSDAGFKYVEYHSLTGGIVAIHTAWRV